MRIKWKKFTGSCYRIQVMLYYNYVKMVQRCALFVAVVRPF